MLRTRPLHLLVATMIFGLAPGVAPRAAAESTAVGVGDEAPDFTLKNQNMEDVSLRSFRGKKNVVLAFYVFAFTGG